MFLYHYVVSVSLIRCSERRRKPLIRRRLLHQRRLKLHRRLRSRSLAMPRQSDNTGLSRLESVHSRRRKLANYNSRSMLAIR